MCLALFPTNFVQKEFVHVREVVVDQCYVLLEMLFQMFHQIFSLSFISVLKFFLIPQLSKVILKIQLN